MPIFLSFLFVNFLRPNLVVFFCKLPVCKYDYDVVIFCFVDFVVIMMWQLLFIVEEFAGGIAAVCVYSDWLCIVSCGE